jgi:hypothetical protein
MPRDFAADYVTVAERIGAFHEKYPEGSIQSEVLTLNDHEVLVKAAAYRTADDPRPGIGHSWLGIPGSTPYTRGSEVENAETSAWGRALAALGFEVKKGIASRDEAQNKEGEQRPARTAAPRPVASRPTPAAAVPPRASSEPSGAGMTVAEAMRALEGIDKRVISDKGKELYGIWSFKEMTAEQRAHVVEELTGGAPPAPDEDWGAVLDQAPAA